MAFTATIWLVDLHPLFVKEMEDGTIGMSGGKGTEGEIRFIR